jgi:hypothetical protein
MSSYNTDYFILDSDYTNYVKKREDLIKYYNDAFESFSDPTRKLYDVDVNQSLYFSIKASWVLILEVRMEMFLYLPLT